MDVEFRAALRKVKQVGGSFDRLNLDTLLDQDELDNLIKHAISAKLRLGGYRLVLHETTPRDELLPGWGDGELEHISTGPDGPGLYRGIQQSLFAIPYPNIPQRFEDLTGQELRLVWDDYVRSLVSSNKRHLETSIVAIPGISEELVRVGAEVYMNGRMAYLTHIWKQVAKPCKSCLFLRKRQSSST